MRTSTKLLSLLIIITTIYWSFSDMSPSYSTKKNENNLTEFSMKNALTHLKVISQKPHNVGRTAHKEVQNYLVNELKKIGLQPEIQTKTIFNNKWKTGTTIENIIAKVKGSSNGKSLVLLSHYDSNPHSSIGAADAGSGVVTILEGIRAFLEKNQKPKNDIIVIFSDAEELGLLGAKAFVNHHPFAKNIGLVLNFEARGSGGPSYMLMETNGKNSKLLKGFLKANPKHPAANSLMYSVYKMLPNDTDLTVFREDGNINGFNFAFIGDHYDYHTIQDTFERLDRNSLAHQKEYLMSNLNYFSSADLSDFSSNEDYVYVNFPFLGLLIYPFSWIFTMLVIAIVLLILIIGIGIRKRRLTLKGITKGFIPFLIAFVSSIAISIGLWKLLLIVHPHYQDILHGFTYNGYQYIAAFTCLTLWIVFKVYNLFKNNNPLDSIVAPIIIWIIINILIYVYLKGAAFMIIPVYFALFGLAILIFRKKRAPKSTLFAILSIPTVYIFSPLIKMFPVGLGLKNLFIIAVFTVLVLGLLIPAFQEHKKKNLWQYLVGFLSILFFLLATFNSGFSKDKKRPNSLVYIQDSEDKTAFWGTYNKTLDNYTKQIFDTDYTKGGIPNAETKSKYNTKFSYYKKAEFKAIATSKIEILSDTIIGNSRNVKLQLNPKRKVSKYEIYNNKELSINYLKANSGVIIDQPTELKNQALMVFHMANADENLTIEISFNKNQKPSFTISEISNDLLEHKKFNLKPRSEEMIPMPFVTNDAIICITDFSF
ncbi:M20/M25/M40 family metallo-hydrolase [uncultured Tenacibaculum sp.]|uniref:M20/M25/M40 family metallo-hydrolase n=1 Tax=uncultured Tenacibaculum sp. TaxID=174713 RepID=UPI00261900F5|nr:M20/M25/M40 family metallo-hydrolase [uncultured Tenacibaculum sp.]